MKQNQAMDKLRDEMAKAPDHPGIGVLGEYMTERLQREPALADRILEKGKTLEAAFGKIRDHARKIAVKGAACVEDKKAFEIACEYYGIAPEGEKAAPEPTGPAASPLDDPLDLDELLEG